MTYKELVDTLTTIIDDHRLINQWGYGNLSDIETPETGAPNYPYVFINPVQVLIQSYGFDVTLNLITMDQPLEGVGYEIDATSRTLGLIQDIIAQFKQTTLYAETDVLLSVSCTPFKERFKDSVIGTTAVVTFQIEEPLDACSDVISNWESLVSRRAHIDHTLDFDGFPDGEDNFFNAFEYSYDGVTWVLSGTEPLGTKYNRFAPTATQDYKIEFDMQVKFNEPEDLSGQLRYGLGLYVPGLGIVWETETTNQAWVSSDTVVDMRATFEGTLTTGYEYYYVITEYYSSTPTADEIGYQLAGSQINFSKAI